MASNLECSIAAKGSDTIWDYTCSACQELEAQFHCDECCKGFCDSCVKLHNQLYKTHSVFGRERMEEWSIAKSTLDILEQCTEHKDEKIKLFCEDHSKLCCHICVAIHHRTCRITYLIDETNTYSTADVHQLSSNIQKVLEEMRELKNVADCNLQSLEKTLERIKEKINSMRQEINASLDLLENATIQEVDKLIASSKISITKESNECDIIQKRLQCLIEAVNEVCNKSSKLLFIAVEKKSTADKGH